jgi:hypothetical protein
MTITVAAVVAPEEASALVAAAEQLREALSHASDADVPVALRFYDNADAIDLPAETTIVIASLLPELAHPDSSLAEVEARWQASLTALCSRFQAAFVCTIFRYLGGENEHRFFAASPSRIEHLRRLNLLAAQLSHATGAGVVDFDRVFAHVGARKLKTDAMLGGALAAEVAGYSIVASILAVGLDAAISPDIQARAEKYQGLLPDLGSLLARRLPATASCGGHG